MILSGPSNPSSACTTRPSFHLFYSYLSRVLGLKSGCHQTNFDFIWIINASELCFCICEVDLMAPASSNLKQRRGRLHKALSECTVQGKQVSYITTVVSGVHTKAVDEDAFQCPYPWVGFQNQSLMGSLEPLVVC